MSRLSDGRPGTYVLVLWLNRRARIRVGSLGERHFHRGWYLYVGSAFGPGGVAARCGHHRRVSARPRWHVDYLRAKARLRQIWYTHDTVRREHQWATLLASMDGYDQPVPGFGASDCDCGSHLFCSGKKPDFKRFSGKAERELSAQDVIICEFV